MPAGELHSGEQIVREGGAAPATVTALREVTGQADYYYIDSPSFKQFIEDTHPGYTFRDGPDGDWEKVMETWKRGGVERENHCWAGRKEFAGEYYHYHYSGDPRSVH